MSGSNGEVAPNDGGTPATMPPDEAIDSTIQAVETEVVDTRAIKAEQEAVELRQQMRAQQDMIGELRKTTVSQSEMLSELVGGMRDAKSQSYQYQLDHLKAVQRKATSEADVATFDAAADQIKMLEQQRPAAETKAAKPNNPASVASDPAVLAWVGENPWYNTDPKLRIVANAVDATLLVDEPHLPVSDRLKKVREAVVSANPAKFPNQARQQPPAVSRPGPQSTAKPKAKEPTLADLDEDSKAALAAIKRIDPKFKDETYLKGFKEREARQKELSRL